MEVLQLVPFAKEAKDSSMGAMDLIGNILWTLILEWKLALANLLSVFLFTITIIGTLC